jgi:KipI family sensor histidine kinase inhibitor
MLTRFNQSHKSVIHQKYHLEAVSQSAVVIFDDDNENIQMWLHAIQLEDASFVIDLIASFNALLIEFDILQTDYYRVSRWLSTLNLADIHERKSNTFKVLVCYEDIGAGADSYIDSYINSGLDKKYPNDLAEISQQTGLTIDDIIKMHHGHAYRVYAVGFMPNFAYLGQLPSALSTPRLSTPRVKVPAGAVAIADRQTAIYPQASPGGWHIIGYTNCLNRPDFSQGFEVGDSIEFCPISKEAFLNSLLEGKTQGANDQSANDQSVNQPDHL